jgi:hypothetical protein
MPICSAEPSESQPVAVESCRLDWCAVVVVAGQCGCSMARDRAMLIATNAVPTTVTLADG